MDPIVLVERAIAFTRTLPPKVRAEWLSGTASEARDERLPGIAVDARDEPCVLGRRRRLEADGLQGGV